MKAFAVKGNAKVNSRQSSDGGVVKVSCRQTLPYLLTKIRRIVKAFAVNSNAKVNSTHTCDGGDAKLSCRVKHCHFLT